MGAELAGLAGGGVDVAVVAAAVVDWGAVAVEGMPGGALGKAGLGLAEGLLICGRRMG